MARRRKSGGGSGVIAGVIVAVIAFMLLSRYMTSSSKIDFSAGMVVNPPKPGDFFDVVSPSVFGLPSVTQRITYGGV